MLKDTGDARTQKDLENIREWPKLLAKTGQDKKFCGFMAYFPFIEEKVKASGTGSAIQDYNLVSSTHLKDKIKPENIKALRLIQQSLRQIQDIVDADPSQLAGQLWAKLIDSPHPAHQQLCEKIAESQEGKSWVKPVIMPETFKQQPLLLPIQAGFSSEVRAAAISGNGQWVIASASFGDTLHLWDINRQTDPTVFSIYDQRYFTHHLGKKDSEEFQNKRKIRVIKLGISHAGKRAIAVCDLGENTPTFSVIFDCKSGDKSHSTLQYDIADDLLTLPISDNGIFLIVPSTGIIEIHTSGIETRYLSYHNYAPLYEICLPEAPSEDQRVLVQP